MNIKKCSVLVVMLFTLFSITIDSASATPPKKRARAAETAPSASAATPATRDVLTKELKLVIDKEELDENDTSQVERLLRAGANPKACSSEGTPLLCVAAGKGNASIVRLLLDWGADPTATDKSGIATSLHAAVRGGRLDVVSLLLGRGINPDIANSGGCTPLHWAAANGRVDVAHLLLEGGARTDVFSNEGFNPLHTAIFEKRGNADVVRQLLEMGADPDAVDKSGNTPLNMAIGKNAIGMVRLLLDWGADPNVVAASDFIDLNALDDFNTIRLSALHVAARCGYVDIIPFLLQAGADPAVRNERFGTAMNVLLRLRGINTNSAIAFLNAVMIGNVLLPHVPKPLAHLAADAVARVGIMPTRVEAPEACIDMAREALDPLQREHRNLVVRARSYLETAGREAALVVARVIDGEGNLLPPAANMIAPIRTAQQNTALLLGDAEMATDAAALARLDPDVAEYCRLVAARLILAQYTLPERLRAARERRKAILARRAQPAAAAAAAASASPEEDGGGGGGGGYRGASRGGDGGGAAASRSP